MKKLISIILGVVFLSGCSELVQAEDNGNKRFSSHNSQLDVITDNETNCKYILFNWNGRGGITPLLKSDGEPDCD